LEKRTISIAMKRLKQLGLYCLLLTFWMSASFARPLDNSPSPPCPMHKVSEHGEHGDRATAPDCCKHMDHQCSNGIRFSACSDGVDCHGGVATVAIPSANLSSSFVPVRFFYARRPEHRLPPGNTAPRWRPPAVT